LPKMKRALITTLMVFMGVTGVAYAQSYRMELSVSNNAIFGALDAKHFVSRGYMRAGIDGIYSDEDDEDYKILNPKMLVGSETLYPGLQCELGFRGIIGTAEKGDDKGNMGGVGFAGNVAFTFPQSVSPIPIKLFANLTGAPRPLSFLDMERYFELSTGIGVYVVENAAIFLSYRYYDFGIEKDSDNFNITDDTFMIGLELQF
jgi:opacity protein-like surface antigen